jgi:hypothetical protein
VGLASGIIVGTDSSVLHMVVESKAGYMANTEQLDILQHGVEAWNEWRALNRDIIPDLSEAFLPGENLIEADLSMANLTGTDLAEADLFHANLSGANLSGAYLFKADLNAADLTGANLRRADLEMSILIRADLRNADLTGCRVYGASVWNVRLENAIQKNLIVTPEEEPMVQVDQLEVAQFVYLLLNNASIRHVIDTITSKVVLILGRFTEERKPVLDALRAELRSRDYLPILFDWQKPSNRDLTETVSTLAHMAKFVVADITDAKSIPQELMAIVPNLPSVPIQPLLLSSQSEYGMFEHFRHYPWVLPVAFYESQEQLIGLLEQKLIAPAESKLRELKRNVAMNEGAE